MKHSAGRMIVCWVLLQLIATFLLVTEGGRLVPAVLLLLAADAFGACCLSVSARVAGRWRCDEGVMAGGGLVAGLVPEAVGYWLPAPGWPNAGSLAGMASMITYVAAKYLRTISRDRNAS